MCPGWPSTPRSIFWGGETQSKLRSDSLIETLLNCQLALNWKKYFSILAPNENLLFLTSGLKYSNEHFSRDKVHSLDECDCVQVCIIKPNYPTSATLPSLFYQAPEWFFILIRISHLCLIINTSANFVIYFAVCKKFKLVLKRTIKGFQEKVNCKWNVNCKFCVCFSCKVKYMYLPKINALILINIFSSDWLIFLQ